MIAYQKRFVKMYQQLQMNNIMTQEDKDLLLQDLCARLPYGVILNCCNIVSETLTLIDYKGLVNNDYDIDEVKPYLFPLSKMSDQQKEEYYYIVNYLSEDDTENCAEGEFIYTAQLTQLLCFYHRNNIDYRGLIPMGLAIDATGLDIY